MHLMRYIKMTKNGFLAPKRSGKQLFSAIDGFIGGAATEEIHTELSGTSSLIRKGKLNCQNDAFRSSKDKVTLFRNM